MDAITRRDMLKTGGLATAALALGGGLLPKAFAQSETSAVPAGLLPGAFDAEGRATLPPLPYAADALAPHIDAETMTIHHDRHHQAYVDGFNAALDRLAEARESGDFGLVEHWTRKLTFNGGGHVLHTLFWATMSPGGGGEPAEGAFGAAIERDFGSHQAMKDQLVNAAKSVEGSGWGLLTVNLATGRLLVHQAQNQNLQSVWAEFPLVMIDVWEHAYYLTYRNDRAAYVNAFFEVVDWAAAAARFEALAALSG